MKQFKYPDGLIVVEIDGKQYFAEYMGRQKGFECCVCGNGCNAYTFNILHGETPIEAEQAYKNDDYETWGYGPTHINHVNFIKKI